MNLGDAIQSTTGLAPCQTRWGLLSEHSLHVNLEGLRWAQRLSPNPEDREAPGSGVCSQEGTS